MSGNKGGLRQASVKLQRILLLLWGQLGLLTGSQMLGETCQQFRLLVVLVYEELSLPSTGTGVGWGH